MLQKASQPVTFDIKPPLQPSIAGHTSTLCLQCPTVYLTIGGTFLRLPYTVCILGSTAYPTACHLLELLVQKEGDSFIGAYGRILGTQLVCCWLAVILSFMPPRMLKRCFPPMVTGLTIFLIGAGLIGTGLKVSCPQLPLCLSLYMASSHAEQVFSLVSPSCP